MSADDGGISIAFRICFDSRLLFAQQTFHTDESPTAIRHNNSKGAIYM